VRQHLFAPAGMANSAFVEDEPELRDFATGYWKGFDDKDPVSAAPPILESWAGGAGAIVSTVADLAAWDNALATGKIVSADDFALMSAPYKLKDGQETAYGMGLGIDNVYGHPRIWHNGGSNGSLTMNATYPKDHLDIIVFENDRRADPRGIESAVFDTLFPDVVAAEHRSAP
jgi:D-alanyl-D-alanine carboxypeptidase